MNPIKILLVEDNRGDVILTREALADGGFVSELKDLPDGEEALKYLHGQPPYEYAERPDLILLDINMPKMSGLEVLGQVKCDAALKQIPIIMLTTSSSDNDVNRAYTRYANAYLTKPVDYNDFLETVGAIAEFWGNFARLPKSER